MTTPTLHNSAAWAHLPNARTAAMLINHASTHLALWEAAWYESRGLTTYTRRTVAWDTVWHVHRADPANDAARAALRDSRWDVPSALVRDALRGPCAALTTWEHCAAYLTLPHKELVTMADAGDHAAALLIPAVLAAEAARRAKE
jgi:hypothetical protein